VSPIELLTAGTTVAVGACLQGAVGFGLGLLAAGAISGFTGTASSIGGPPIALIYQRAHGQTLRGTLALYFLVGSVLSVLVLAAFGKLDGKVLLESAQLVPFMIAGFACSTRAAKLLDRGRTRQAVLMVSTVSAIALIANQLLR
jgi:uncharacterized membrane protein YfcA